MVKGTVRPKVVAIKCGVRKCGVSRPLILVKTGDWVKFYNPTPDWIYIQFSDNSLFPARPFKIASGRHKTLRVRRARRGIYPYAVFCAHHSRFCTASSMPIIIVPR